MCGSHRSSLLRVILVHLLQCLVSKLNIITGRHIGKKHRIYQGLVKSSVSGIHWGAWDMFPAGKRGLLSMKSRQTLGGITMPPTSPGGVLREGVKSLQGLEMSWFFYLGGGAAGTPVSVYR